MARPIANPITYGTLSGNVPMSDLDTSFNALFTTGFNDSSLGWVNYAADTGVANAYAVTLGVTPSSYTTGMCVAFTPQNSNTGGSTINVNSLGAKSIFTSSGGALSGGELPATFTPLLVYDGTNFRIVGCNYQPVTAFFNTSSNQTVSCDGASSVAVFWTQSANTNPILSLARLRLGIPVYVTINFQTFTSSTLFITATTPSGVSDTINLVVQGASGIQTGIVSSVSVFWTGSGSSYSNGVNNNLNMAFSHT